MTLFEGHSSSYGTYTLTGEVKENGKCLGVGKSITKVLTVENYSQHLLGKVSLGITPINAESKTKFGAIDIDEYPIDLQLLARRIKEQNLPLIVCRTKSGGAHLYLFTKELVSAAIMQKKLREMAQVLGYGTCDIYPKQSKILAERGDNGNWINLPYFDEVKTLRYAIGPDYKGMKFPDFIKHAMTIAVGAVALHNMKFTAPELLSGGPPCLQQLCSQGFPDGTRNNGLTNLGIYAQKAYSDGWEAKLEELNRQYMKPPLPNTEVLGVIKSLKKKTYQYTCKSQPIQAFCNAAVCRTCRFGVGGAELGMPKFGTLTKLKTSPPIWFLDVETEDGVGRMELTTEELQTPLQFQKRCMEALNIMPAIVKRETWTVIVQKLLMEMTVVEAPEDLTPEGVLMSHLETFCTRFQAKAVDELLLGKPWHNDKEVHIRLNDFVAYLELKKFKLLPLNKIAGHLRALDGFRKYFHNIKGKGVNVYVFPDHLFQKQKESFDTPEQPQDVL